MYCRGEIQIREAVSLPSTPLRAITRTGILTALSSAPVSAAPTNMALSQLELERQARIAANQARLQSIGLLDTVQGIASAQVAAARTHRKAPAARASGAARRAAGTLPPGRVRR